jgi:hypothetical protein
MAHFEREVPTYAEPVSMGNLKDGEIYFSVRFVDQDLLIPIVETLVFTGKDLKAGDAGALYFQDVESYQRGIRYESPGADDADFYVQHEHNINHIFEYERALDRLISCALQRRKIES